MGRTDMRRVAKWVAPLHPQVPKLCHQLEWYHESQQIPVFFAQSELQHLLKHEKLCNLLPLDLGQDVQ